MNSGASLTPTIPRMNFSVWSSWQNLFIVGGKIRKIATVTLETDTTGNAEEWRDRTGEIEFQRRELRHTRSERTLDCGCYIPPRFEYWYYVAKVWAIAGLIQVTQCESCGRRYGDERGWSF